jgi:hypothetical protein
MSKFLAGIAALALAGAATMPISASATERQAGISTDSVQSTELSSRHRRWHHRRHFYGYRYYGPRRYYGYQYYHPRRYYYGPRYGYYGYRYPYYGYPYRYYRPGITLGLGPFGFGVF